LALSWTSIGAVRTALCKSQQKRAKGEISIDVSLQLQRIAARLRVQPCRHLTAPPVNVLGRVDLRPHVGLFLSRRTLIIASFSSNPTTFHSSHGAGGGCLPFRLGWIICTDCSLIPTRRSDVIRSSTCEW